MNRPASKITTALEAHRRTLSIVLAVVLSTNTFLVVRQALEPSASSRAASDPSLVGGGALPSQTAKARKAAREAARRAAARATPLSVRTAKPGTYIPGIGTVPRGLSGNKIKIVYYWDHKTRNSQFLEGADADLDEGKAFRALVDYINKHANGGTFMGFKFDLHGWQLSPEVVDAGKGDDTIRAAETIATSIKPFLAISSHGSVSTNVCPRLARAGIFNISTFDLDWDILERTNGYCRPAGISFNSQVDLSVAYLREQAKTPYREGGLSEPRKYGFLYAEYRGLKDIAPQIVKRLKAAGVPIVATEAVDPDLTTAQRQQPTVIANFRDAGVNTIIAPESGSLISFTHAADGAVYTPDYYVWPCSGQDSLGMVRLYSATQWANAKGLSCYDEHLNADLGMDDVARDSEWYDQFKEVRPSSEPPAPTALIYQGLLPLLVGVTHAGRDLTLERFREGLAEFKSYRYNAIDGRSKDPRYLLVSLGLPDGSVVGDAAEVSWDNSKSRRGSATSGTYVYSDRRYRPGTAF